MKTSGYPDFDLTQILYKKDSANARIFLTIPLLKKIYCGDVVESVIIRKNILGGKHEGNMC